MATSRCPRHRETHVDLVHFRGSYGPSIPRSGCHLPCRPLKCYTTSASWKNPRLSSRARCTHSSGSTRRGDTLSTYNNTGRSPRQLFGCGKAKSLSGPITRILDPRPHLGARRYSSNRYPVSTLSSVTPRVCNHRNVLPSSHVILDGLREANHSPVACGGFANLREGTLRDRKVCVKVPRTYNADTYHPKGSLVACGVRKSPVRSVGADIVRPSFWEVAPGRG